MSDLHDQSSGLHWKKELTALRKAARFLRDPETSSSWRSPLSSRSVATASNLYNINGTNRNSVGVTHSGRYSELDSCFPVKLENKQKQVFLYNWRHQSSKSSDSGAKLDGDRYLKESSVPVSPGNSSSDAHREGSKSDTYLEEHVGAFRVGDATLETPVQRTVKKFRKSSAVSRQRIARKSINSKALDAPSCSLGGPITSVEQSDDTEYCNSEDFRNLAHDFIRNNGFVSKSTSPMLPQSANWSHSSRLLKNTRREDSSFSCTPASTSSYNQYGNHNPSIVSWDGTTTSFDGDEVENFDLQKRQGRGITCYGSKRIAKHRGCGGCYSPSLSNTLRRKGSSILCGSQTLYRKHRSSRSNKKLVSSSAQGLPLLTNSCDGGQDTSMDSVQSDDELSTNFGELDLEALSRLDGQRWSFSCRSQEGLELVPLTGVNQRTPDHVGSLSQKYRPRFFEEIIGQNIVVQSLINAISRGRIAPVYLFQGPRGTGKTTTARIFAAALNCIAIEENKPCGSCRDCIDFVYGRGMDLKEVEATNKKGIERVRYLLKSLSVAPSSHFSRYKVLIIDECHLLPSKTWSIFLKFLEEPPANVVFIFITTDLDNLPRVVLSRCQKYLFNKIKEADIVTRLKKLAASENLDVELHALDLIALNADGSLRDAETMLDQLSLLGKRITASLVNELVGVVSEEKLLDLLELAMSSDTAETVKRARELMDSGVDPMALMSQLAGLIMDIIAGTYQLVDSNGSNSLFGGRSLTEAELERLKLALKLLLEAEKQLRTSSERSTWFTAALLQLGSVPSPVPTHSGSSRKQNSKSAEEDPSGTSWDYTQKKRSGIQNTLQNSTSSSSSMATAVGCSGGSGTPHKDNRAGSEVVRCVRPDMLDNIWERCINRCHSKTLKQLLHVHGKLLSISEVEGVLIAFVAFENEEIKSRAERFLSSITNSMETVVKRNVEVRIRLMPEREASTNKIKPVESPDPSLSKNMEINQVISKESKSAFSNSKNSNLDPHLESHRSATESFNCAEVKLPRGTIELSDCSTLQNGHHQITTESPVILEEKVNGTERKKDIPMQRIQNIIDEQRLETAWLQAAEKGTPESLNRLKAERSQVLPQDDVSYQKQMLSTSPVLSSQKWEDELNRELKALKINSSKGYQKDQSGQKFDHFQMSPSLLHSRGYPTNISKENLGYESGTSAGGCRGCLCWNSKHHNRRKVKQGHTIRSPRRSNFSLFGQYGKVTKIEDRLKR